jgi:hypothetical protein
MFQFLHDVATQTMDTKVYAALVTADFRPSINIR